MFLYSRYGDREKKFTLHCKAQTLLYCVGRWITVGSEVHGANSGVGGWDEIRSVGSYEVDPLTPEPHVLWKRIQTHPI